MAEFLPILLVLLWPLFLLSALGGAGYLAWRAVRALEAKGASAPELVALRERVELLEEQLEAQNAELRRVADGQQFTEKLLENRARKGL
jgi:hypothetical protein